MIATTYALPLLLEELKEYNVSYFLTNHLNQDCLENFNFCVHQRGGMDDHPSPSRALYRIRSIIMSHDPASAISARSNTINHGDETFLIRDVMKEPNLLPDASPEEQITDENLFNKENDSIENSDTANNIPDIPIHLQNVQEKDGFQYLVGYLARKLQKDEKKKSSNSEECLG